MIPDNCIFANSNIGRLKRDNQDNYLVRRCGTTSQHAPVMLAVSDGMGGEKGGAHAAAIAMKTVSDFCDTLQGVPPQSPEEMSALAEGLRKTVLAAHDTVRIEAGRDPELRYMGATLTALIVCHGWGLFCHVGDCRIYRFRERNLERMTTDHRFLDELVAVGDMTPQEAAVHPLHNRLDQALGTPGCVPDCGLFSLRPGDRLLLCSDGLTDEADEADIAAELSKMAPPKTTAEHLIQLALERGGRDNITVILAEIME